MGCKRGVMPSKALVVAWAKQEAIRYRVPIQDIFSDSKMMPLPWVRWHIHKRLRDEGYSLPCIAARFGQDHTTVLYGIESLNLPQYQNYPGSESDTDYNQFLKDFRAGRKTAADSPAQFAVGKCGGAGRIPEEERKYHSATPVGFEIRLPRRKGPKRRIEQIPVPRVVKPYVAIMLPPSGLITPPSRERLMAGR